MTLQRTIICVAGAWFGIGCTEVRAGGPEPICDLTIEVNALRGGSPTVTVNETKNITAKARILKGSAPAGTTIDTTLRIEVVDGSEVIHSQSSFPHRLEVGKGGTVDKFAMSIPKCDAGFIVFVATFFGLDDDGDFCEGTETLRKECK